MKKHVQKLLALTLSVSLLTAYSPLTFATEHMDISDTQTITGESFEELAITGNGGAITLTDTGNATVQNSSFTGNSATEFGGAIYNPAGGQVVLENTTFTNNAAYKKGGAIYNAGTLEVKDGASFVGNTTTWDGAAGSGPEDTNANGGAIWNSGTLTLGDNITFKNNALSENVTSGHGHGSDIYNYGGNVTVGDNATFTRDELASVHDCSIFSSNGTVTLGNNATFHNVNEAIVTSGTAEVTIGDNLHVQDVGNGIASWGKSLTVGKNAMFENIIGSRVFQTVSGNQTFTFGDGLIVQNNINVNSSAAFGTIYNEKNSAMHFEGSSSFINNQAPLSNAGVFQNWSTLTFNGPATFTGNMANGDAGALRNRGTSSHTTFDDNVTFTGNGAVGNGGAVLNEGTLVFNKDVTFSQNISNGTVDYIEDENGIFYDPDTGKHYTFAVTDGVANDIYNTGTVTFNGTANLDGGITGTGTVNVNQTMNIGTAVVNANTLNFADNSTLGVTFTNDTMGNLNADTIAIGDGAKLAVTLSKDFLTTTTTSHDLVNDGAAVTGEFTLANADNALYHVSLADNIVTAERKAAEETKEAIMEAGGNDNAVAVVETFTSSADLGSEKANKAADIINQLAQTDVAAAVHAAKALAPEENYSRQVVHTVNTNEIFSAVNSHIANVAGNTSAPAPVRTYALGNKQQATYQHNNYSVWAQGLLNKTHKAAGDTSAFTGRSTGLAGGADITLGQDWLLGAGYAYTHTNVSSLGRHNRILGDNFLLYGQYRPGQFFVQSTFTYGRSKYEEEKYVGLNTIDADYHINSYALNVTTGYDVTDWLTPSVGVRYMTLQQEGYKDSADQSVSADQSSFFTGVFGAKVQQLYTLRGGLRILPQVRAGVAYDFVSDATDSKIGLPNGTGYAISAERLHRLAFETGFSLTTWIADSLEIAAGYEGSFRTDYESHTGTLKLRYTF